MNKDTIEFLINAAIYRGRNIVYYRERDTRMRCQYIHVVREYRERLVNILPQVPKTHPARSMFIELIKAINPKVKSEGCVQTIINIKNILVSHGVEIK